MHRKTFSLATALLFSLFTVSVHAADAPDVKAPRLHAAIGKSDGGFTIVNMTQNQVISAQFGDAVATTLAHPIAPGASAQLDGIMTKPCGVISIVVTYDDDTETTGSVDLCTVRKLTLHGDTLAQ